MRRLVLQSQITLDGYAAADSDELDWQVWDWGPAWSWDPALRDDFNTVFDHVDMILLSRPMIEGGYLDHWHRTAEEHPTESDYRFARRIVDVEKIVVTRQELAARSPRVTVRSQPPADIVEELKATEGVDIISFGGIRFASALLRLGLVDELQLFVNPTAVGAGASIFGHTEPAGRRFTLLGSRAYPCGVIVNRYQPRPH